MERIKVALIHNIIAPYRIPLFEGLAKHPCLDFFVYYCSEIHKERKWKIIESDQYNYKVLSGITIETTKTGIQYHINPSIIKTLKKNQYEVIIIGGYSDFTTQLAFFISKIMQIPVILSTEGIKPLKKYWKIINPFEKLIIRNVNAIVVPGLMSKDFHINMGAEPKKIFTAPDNVNNKIFIEKSQKYKKEKQKYKKKKNLANKKIILYIGQLIPRKGVEYLIRAYKKLRYEKSDICLVIIGDGILKQDLINICNEEKIKDVYFTGWVSEEEKIIYYSISEVFVLPTLEDIWGLVINEAMACGLPIIITRVAGASEMVMPDKNGYIIEEKNIEQLYQSLKKITSNNDFSEKMGKKSLDIIKNKYNLENMVNGYFSAIEYAIKK